MRGIPTATFVRRGQDCHIIRCHPRVRRRLVRKGDRSSLRECERTPTGLRCIETALLQVPDGHGPLLLALTRHRRTDQVAHTRRLPRLGCAAAQAHVATDPRALGDDFHRPWGEITTDVICTTVTTHLSLRSQSAEIWTCPNYLRSHLALKGIVARSRHDWCDDESKSHCGIHNPRGTRK